LQQLVDRLHGISSRFGLPISDTKEVQIIGKDQHQLCIGLNVGNIPKQTNEFVYLGGLISEDNDCDIDIARRIGIASSAVREL